MKGLILAGGKGTRLRPLTINTPKPIVPVANRPFILYQIDLMKSAGITEIILSLAYQPQKIQDLLKDGSDLDVLIRYAIEPTPLGTAGAFKNAERWIDSTTVVFNGDVLTSLDLTSLIQTHRRNKASATLALTPVEDPTSYGLVETNAAGKVQRFLEKPNVDQITCNTINAGIYVLEGSILQYTPHDKPSSFERNLFPALLANNQSMHSVVSDGYWIDLGTPEKYQEVHRDILSGRFIPLSIPENSLDRRSLPSGAFVDERSIIGEGVKISENTRIENSVIGSGCKIAEGTQIKDCVIWSDNTIDADARISGTLMGSSCYIGRAATLRPGSLLGENTLVTEYSSL